MLLTAEQLREIRQVIEDHHSAFIANAIDPSAMAPEVLRRLKAKGMIDPGVESIKDSYLYGQLVAILESAQIAKMGYAEFKKFLAKNPIPLSKVEHQAIQMATESAAQYCRGLGNTVNVDTGAVLIEADAKLRATTEAGIVDATVLNIARRQSVKQLKTDLGWMAKDWARDWTRIAVTEKQTAMLHGQGDAYRKEHGGDVLVAKRPMNDACQWCKKVYRDPNDQPRIFKLSTLEANGTNVGRKAADYRATIGTLHPFCLCNLVRIPAGWGFDDKGDLVPDGKLGYVYDDEGDLMLAMRQEDNLQKAFKLQGHVEYQGLKIAIENRKGSVRKWKDAAGNSGKTRMKVGYGYIKRTSGTDGEEIDCFVGPDPRAENAYVVEQLDPNTGLYDEQKCFLGFGNQDLAIACYREHYDKPDEYIFTVSPMAMDAFKRWVGATAPEKANGLQKGLRLVVPLEKAQVPPEIGAATSPAANRAPGPGLGANYVFLPWPKRERDDKTRVVPAAKELVEPLELPEKNPMKRDKEEYHYDYPMRIVVPIELPADIYGKREAREEEIAANMRHIVRIGTDKIGPRNMAEVAEAARRPVLKKAGPYIGPRGGKWKDAAHTVPWKSETPPAAEKKAVPKLPPVKTPREHVAVAKRLIRLHAKALPRIKAAMAKAAGKDANVQGRVKTLESALGKLIRKPDEYLSADKLQDITGTRIIHSTVEQVKSTVTKLKDQYRVVGEDDYIDKPQGNYRSHHLILEDPETKLKFEVQIRTKNQNTFADWAHNVYKPVSEEQAKHRADPEVSAYESGIAAYFWALDTKARPPNKPPCTPVIKQAFGCL